MKTSQLNVRITDELAAAIAASNFSGSLAAFVERELWKSHAVKRGAEAAGVKQPERIPDRRGTYQRKTKGAAK